MIARAARRFWNGAWGGVGGSTGYEGVDPNDVAAVRKHPQGRITHEDAQLHGRRRHELASNTQDLQRNWVLVPWAIRKHLDYVTSFNFQARTNSQEFNKDLEAFVANWSRRENFDISRRHRRQRALRMAEARRIVDGDILSVKVLSDEGRGRIQFIEADRVWTPDNTTRWKEWEQNHELQQADWINGVRIDARTNEAMGYAICDRSPSGTLDYSHTLPAYAAYHHAYYDGMHRMDMVRGISPIAAALSSLAQTRKGFDLVLARIQLEQLFGLKITKTEEGETYANAAPYAGVNADGSPDVTTGTPAEDPNATSNGYKVDLSGEKNFLLDLAPNEDADFLSTATPAPGTIEFLRLMIQLTLKALNIPFSFFSEDFTNFFGSRGALLHYRRSAKCNIEDNQEQLTELTNWRIALAIADGELIVPKSVGFDGIKYEYVPEGFPWWDPSKEVRANLEAVAGAFDSPQNVCRMNNTDYFENIDKIAEAQEYAESKGVEVSWAIPDLMTPPGGAVARANAQANAQQASEDSDDE